MKIFYRQFYDTLPYKSMVSRFYGRTSMVLYTDENMYNHGCKTGITGEYAQYVQPKLQPHFN